MNGKEFFKDRQAEFVKKIVERFQHQIDYGLKHFPGNYSTIYLDVDRRHLGEPDMSNKVFEIIKNKLYENNRELILLIFHNPSKSAYHDTYTIAIYSDFDQLPWYYRWFHPRRKIWKSIGK